MDSSNSLSTSNKRKTASLRGATTPPDQENASSDAIASLPQSSLPYDGPTTLAGEPLDFQTAVDNLFNAALEAWELAENEDSEDEEAHSTSAAPPQSPLMGQTSNAGAKRPTPAFSDVSSTESEGKVSKELDVDKAVEAAVSSVRQELKIDKAVESALSFVRSEFAAQQSRAGERSHHAANTSSTSKPAPIRKRGRGTGAPQWSQTEIDQLIQSYTQGNTPQEICKGLPGRSESACNSMIHKQRDVINTALRGNIEPNSSFRGFQEPSQATNQQSREVLEDSARELGQASVDFGRHPWHLETFRNAPKGFQKGEWTVDEDRKLLSMANAGWNAEDFEHLLPQRTTIACNARLSQKAKWEARALELGPISNALPLPHGHAGSWTPGKDQLVRKMFDLQASKITIPQIPGHDSYDCRVRWKVLLDGTQMTMKDMYLVYILERDAISWEAIAWSGLQGRFTEQHVRAWWAENAAGHDFMVYGTWDESKDEDLLEASRNDADWNKIAGIMRIPSAHACWARCGWLLEKNATQEFDMATC